MRPLADQAARDRAVCDFSTPLVVVAGAGTGKTTTLVARVATWLVGPGFDEAETEARDAARAAASAVDGVLAITFTKAAAAEMDSRLRAVLRDIEHGATPTGVLLHGDAAAVRARARALRLALDRPLATTIHGFCQGLLAEHPFESGLPPGFAVDADEDLAQEHARRAAATDLAEAFRGTSDEDWLRLAREGTGPDAVARCVANLRLDGVRGEDLTRDPASDDVLEGLVARLEPAVRAFAPACRVIATLNGANIVGAARLVLDLESVYDDAGRPPPADFVRRIALLVEKGPLEKLAAWAAKGFDKTVIKVLGEAEPVARAAAEQFARAFRPLSRFDLDAFRSRRAVVKRVLARAEALSSEEAVVTFGDLLVRAAALVEDDRGVREKLRRRFRQILVDEFQDTDDVQVRLVRALALGEGRERPGLFLVGDPKQSIYGFRGADLAAYDGFVGEVLDAGGATLELVQNFRSTPRVLAAVERFLAPVLDPEPGVQPPFQPLVPKDDEEGPEVELWATWAPASDPKGLARTPALPARRFEAAELARALRREHARGTPWKEMAVLARSRGSFREALDVLRAEGIPHQVEGDRSYYRRREVVDAAALFGAIVDPGDALSLVAFLRSAACGLPDAALEPLFGRGLATRAQQLGGPDGDTALAEIVRAARDVQAELERDGFPGGRGIPHFAASLEHALASLAILRQSLVADPADRFVEKVRRLVLVEAAESARFQGRFRAANLERFLRRVREELEDSGDAAGVLRALRRSIDAEDQEKEARPAGDVEDAVRFLTIHGAKGLEFESVFLIGLASGEQRGGSRDGFDRMSRELRICGAASPMWSAVEERRSRRDAAERARLLYVAMTRAKRRLALSAVWREAPVSKRTDSAQNFRDLAEHGLPVDFAARAAAALDAGQFEYVDQGFVVRIAATEPDAARRGREERVSVGFAERAAHDAVVLARDEVAAAERQARPRIATAATVGDGEDSSEGAAAGRVGTGRLDRGEARIVGTLVHAALEFAPDFDAARAMLERVVAELDAATAAEARAILESVARGPLVARFRTDTIAARELALVAPARPGESPIEGWTGSADLVLRDGDRWTVVDFKSEALGGRDPRAAAEEHAPQLDLYARALAESLGLPGPPRREVWFLRDGVVAVLD